MTLQMRRLPGLALAFLLTLTSGGCATMTGNSYVERGAEFTHYRLWEWAPAEQVPTGDPRLDSNPFFQDRLRGAVEHAMASRGYVKAALAGQPDLLLRYHVNFSKTYEVTGGSRIGSCYRDCEPDAYAYELGTVVVEAVDSRTAKAVWRGWVRDNMEGLIDRQDAMEAEVDAVVATMFERFPGAPN